MDFKGQKLAERLFQIIIIIGGIIGFVVGFVLQNFQVTASIIFLFAVAAGVLVIPNWSYFNRHPVKWLSESDLRRVVQPERLRNTSASKRKLLTRVRDQLKEEILAELKVAIRNELLPELRRELANTQLPTSTSTQSKSSSAMSSLPAELWLHIFSYLPTTIDLRKVACVSHAWYACAMDPWLWRTHFEAAHPAVVNRLRFQLKGIPSIRYVTSVKAWGSRLAVATKDQLVVLEYNTCRILGTIQRKVHLMKVWPTVDGLLLAVANGDCSISLYAEFSNTLPNVTTDEPVLGLDVDNVDNFPYRYVCVGTLRGNEDAIVFFSIWKGRLCSSSAHSIHVWQAHGGFRYSQAFVISPRRSVVPAAVAGAVPAPVVSAVATLDSIMRVWNDEYLVVGCGDGVIRVFSESAQCIVELVGHPLPKKDLEYVTEWDGRLVSCTVDDVRVWEWPPDGFGFSLGGDIGDTRTTARTTHTAPSGARISSLVPIERLALEGLRSAADAVVAKLPTGLVNGRHPLAGATCLRSWNGRLYVGHYDGIVRAYDKDGRCVWSTARHATGGLSTAERDAAAGRGDFEALAEEPPVIEELRVWGGLLASVDNRGTLCLWTDTGRCVSVLHVGPHEESMSEASSVAGTATGVQLVRWGEKLVVSLERVWAGVVGRPPLMVVTMSEVIEGLS